MSPVMRKARVAWAAGWVVWQDGFNYVLLYPCAIAEAHNTMFRQWFATQTTGDGCSKAAT